jgi:hypothetical protein
MTNRLSNRVLSPIMSASGGLADLWHGFTEENFFPLTLIMTIHAGLQTPKRSINEQFEQERDRLMTGSGGGGVFCSELGGRPAQQADTVSRRWLQQNSLIEGDQAIFSHRAQHRWPAPARPPVWLLVGFI